MNLEYANLASKELHHKIIKNFPRRQVIVNYKDEIWGADLCEMPNDFGHKYILTVIDIYTKYAWGIPLKNKTGESVVREFKSIMDESERVPKFLWADQGKEFYNKKFKTLLNEYDIELYSTYSELKNPVIERLNRTLKEWMEREMTASKLINQTFHWTKILPTIVARYNSHVHSTIKMTPQEATEEKNAERLKESWSKRYSDFQNQFIPSSKFKVGDFIRLYKYKTHFEKGYKSNWTVEIFRIKKMLPTTPVTFKIEDENGEEIDGSVYENEMIHSKFSF